MQAACLRAKWAAITAAPMFEMQKKDTRILKVAGKLMLCPWVTAHTLYGAANL
jgi:hypothetical protein